MTRRTSVVRRAKNNPSLTLTTPHLCLRPYREEDRSTFLELFCDRDVMMHVGGGAYALYELSWSPYSDRATNP